MKAADLTGLGKYADLLKLLAYVGAAAFFFWIGGVREERSWLAKENADLVRLIKERDDARKAEQAAAKRLTDVAEKYEQDKKNAEADHARLVRDLRTGNVRLQDRWAGCVSEAGRTAAELDAAKRDREESAARIIAAADQCDAQNRGLQDVIRADRK